MTPRFARWITGLLALFFCTELLAHATTIGLVRIDLVGDRLTYTLAVALPEIPNGSALLLSAAANGDRAAIDTVADQARRSVRIDLGGAPCKAGGVRIAGGSSTNDARGNVEIDFTCSGEHGRLTVADDWGTFLGEHYQALANIRTASGERQVVFGETSRNESIDISRPVATGWLDFIKLGIEHILTGYDHLLFLLALLAGARGFLSVVKIVTAFTLAHSVTLTLAALGLVNIPDRIIEPLIAATIIWVALENLISAAPDRRRWMWSFGFGLVHGLGFAAALGEIDLKGAALVRALVGFNAGVEIGQLVFVVIALPLLTLLSRGRGATLTPRIASIAAAVMGTYWLIERVFLG
ncbi:HupE/UreJ family protein [Bradyrhizobium manausense]|uniref:HupE/UreJ family protein n=1 Tax=Bradyrhizobium TaxID=374 RepID=UPI001BAB1C46|nr:MULTISPECIES: HupE/UreJ family protein [Bradyrhizobium]MBR0830094.1 HupE/UreJ family protein [Bradyrhizobium manausense]UVO30928.1 HupE/UreJ family protein [Bradyrhizobium arachidis]